MEKPARRPAKRAFTLIELLVVIAIIAILAAILFPVFAQAKEAAKKTTCISNNKQMAVGLYLYAQDSDDTLCQTSWEQDPAFTPNPQNPTGKYQIHWTYLVQPYVKNYDFFRCPSDLNPVTPKNKCASPSELGKNPMTCDWQAPSYSYIPNYNAMPAHDWRPVSMTAFEFPADTILVTERRNKLNSGVVIGQHKGVSGFNPSQPCPNWTLVSGPPGAGQYSYVTKAEAEAHLNDPNDKFDIVRLQWDRHAGGATYSYSDGHAKFRKLDAILDPSRYNFGDRWYATQMPWGAGCP